jgi:hypothetical protein
MSSARSLLFRVVYNHCFEALLLLDLFKERLSRDFIQLYNSDRIDAGNSRTNTIGSSAIRRIDTKIESSSGIGPLVTRGAYWVLEVLCIFIFL